MSSLTLTAPAKINLTLDVGPRRPDGYHEIVSLMQTISLLDTLTLTESAAGISLEIDGPEAEGIPDDARNIVWKATARLQAIYQFPGVHIHLIKQIPSQAGLGGGSSDAAAALSGLNRLFALGLSSDDLTPHAAALGADVAFFLTGGLARAEGLGERITPLPDLTPAWSLVLVKPPVGVSTAWAYAQLDALQEERPSIPQSWGNQTGPLAPNFGGDGPLAPNPGGTGEDQRREAHDTSFRLPQNWGRGGPNVLRNDFEAVALNIPEIRRVYDALAILPGDGPPLLCGSGAAVFKRVPDGEEEYWAEQLRKFRVGQVWAARTEGRTA